MADPGTLHISIFAPSSDGRFYGRYPYGNAPSALLGAIRGIATGGANLKAQASLSGVFRGIIRGSGILTTSATNALGLAPVGFAPAAAFGAPYDAQVSIISGTVVGSVTWTFDSAPAWAILNGSGTNAFITGMPNDAGPYPASDTMIVRATDSVGHTGTVAL